MSHYYYKFQNTLDHIKDEHIQFFILRELFRRKSLLEWLDKRFKESITYKLHLFSNEIFPQRIDLKNEAFREIKKRKNEIDKKIYRKISKTLTLFSKKTTTKTITGKKIGNFLDLEDSKYSWEDPIESPPFLPLIEKVRDNKYSLTGLGLGLLIGISHYSGIETNLTAFLEELAFTLYKKKRVSFKKTIKKHQRNFWLKIFIPIIVAEFVAIIGFVIKEIIIKFL